MTVLEYFRCCRFFFIRFGLSRAITTCIDFHSDNKIYIRFGIRVAFCTLFLFYLEFRMNGPNVCCCCVFLHCHPVNWQNVCVYWIFCAHINYTVLCKSQWNINILDGKFHSRHYIACFHNKSHQAFKYIEYDQRHWLQCFGFIPKHQN